MGPTVRFWVREYAEWRVGPERRKVGRIMHLVRHPLSAVLLVLVALFFVFFVLPPLLHLIFDLVVLAAVVWAVMGLMRFHRKTRRRSL